MRIIYCIPGLYNAGGMERVLTQKVNWLAEKTDWEITIVTTEHVPDGLRTCYFPLNERVKVVELSIDFNADYEKNWWRRISQHICKQRLYKTQLQKVLDDWKPDVWVSMCGKEIEWMGKVNATCRKIAEIHFAIDFREQWLQQQRKGILWSIVGRIRTRQLVSNMRHIDRLVVLTEADMRAWQQRGVNNVSMISNPCSILPDVAGNHQQKQILAVGRLEPQKGFDWLIQAWSYIEKDFPEWQLRICGEGSWRKYLETQTYMLGIHKRVQMDGLDDHLTETYQNSRIFVLPSRYEGLPLALMEAMSCGLCCIAMDCPQGPKELIGEDERGRLIPVGDTYAMARAIAEEIRYPAHARELGRNAFAYAHEHFDIDIIMQQWIQLFTEIHVVHTVNAFTNLSGGTSTCVYDLARGINESAMSLRLKLVVTKPQKAQDRLMGRGEPWITAVNNDEWSAFGFSKNLKHALLCTAVDLYHTNGLWRYCNHVTASVARQKHKPLIITPHGMLYPQALQHSQWQKKLLGWLCFKHDFHRAACVHVTCDEEMHWVRAYGYKGPIAVISNAIFVPKIVAELPERKRAEKVQFGFLGRLHPRKHVERLIQAMAQLSADEQAQCQIVILGKGDTQYEQLLHHEVERLHMNNVEFRGFVTGIDKYAALRQLSALMVPSDFENFGMIIPEALLCHTPVFAGIHTPWRNLNTYQCGWWQEPSVENIVKVMRQVLAMSPEEIEAWGQRGDELIRKGYSSNHIQMQMQQLYQWLLTKTNKPDFIYEIR